MTDSLNPKIDTALRKLMARIDDLTNPIPVDIAVKVINSAIAWEKVKQGKMVDEDPFDPDEL